MKQIVTTISDYPLPDSVDIERLVIAELVSYPSEITSAEKIINVEMFSNEGCRKSWETLRRMLDNGISIDLITFKSNIDNSIFQEVIPYIAKTGTMLSVHSHCNALRDAAMKRKAYFCGVEMIRSSVSAISDIGEIMNIPSKFVEDVNSDYKTEESTKRISEVINELGGEIERIQNDQLQGKRTRIPTGFNFLDALTYSGFAPGNLIILAARPSVGKTAIMLQMAQKAPNSGFSAMIFSLEMTNQELAQRMMFSTGEISPTQIVNGSVNWQSFERAAGGFAGLPMYLNDTARTVEDITSEIILNNRQGKCDIAFIDYLGLIHHRDNKQPLHQAIAEITKTLKDVAKRCRIPIVLLCQLNRASVSEKRPPMLFDLRDSGSIEQDADIVLMLERDIESSNGQGDHAGLNMWVRKNRQGRAGDIAIKLSPNQTYTSFQEVGLMQ